MSGTAMGGEGATHLLCKYFLSAHSVPLSRLQVGSLVEVGAETNEKWSVSAYPPPPPPNTHYTPFFVISPFLAGTSWPPLLLNHLGAEG